MSKTMYDLTGVVRGRSPMDGRWQATDNGRLQRVQVTAMKWFGALLLMVAYGAGAQEPATLAIVDGGARREYSRTELLARPDVVTITVADSVYGKRVTRFKAIAMASLFEGYSVPARAVIQCTGSDGFSAPLQRSRLLTVDPKASQAFLAIEEPGNPWPNLPDESTSAGPFYVMWTQPQASGIGREEWPFKVVSFTVVADPQTLMPHSYPAGDAGPAVMAGFASFQKNCLPCHRINGDGNGSIGPDLNRPANPTDYLQPEALRRLIRDPRSVRSWPGMKMAGFSTEAISDAELTNLIAYLQYLGRRPSAN